MTRILSGMRDTSRSWNKAFGDFYDEDLEWVHRLEH